MNWKEIKTHFPKAFKEFQGTGRHVWDVATMFIKEKEVSFLAIFDEGFRDYEERGSHELRDLYDFFDKHGIYLIIGINGSIFYYDIFPQEKENYGYKTRHDAEASAFYDAFEILEEKINNGSQKTIQ